MSRRESSSDPDLQALFASGKEVPRQPELVRARVLARARATAASPLQTAASSPATPWPGRRYAVALAASAALAMGMAGAVYALSGRGSRGHEPSGAPSATSAGAASAQPPAAVTAPSADEPPRPASARSTLEADGSPRTDAARPHTRRPAEPQASYDAELRLMHGAHTAYAAHAFANALVLVSEHARLFPAGLLAEEREALRVRCLLGSGRTSEAQRAAAAFATHFPRSVLLPRLPAEAEIKAP
jgi:hypothetical protein